MSRLACIGLTGGGGKKLTQKERPQEARPEPPGNAHVPLAILPSREAGRKALTDRAARHTQWGLDGRYRSAALLSESGWGIRLEGRL